MENFKVFNHNIKVQNWMLKKEEKSPVWYSHLNSNTNFQQFLNLYSMETLDPLFEVSHYMRSLIKSLKIICESCHSIH